MKKQFSGSYIYLGCIKNYNKKVIGMIGRIKNNKYISMFLKINENSYIDLSSNELYKKEEAKNIQILNRLNPNKMFSNKSLKKVLDRNEYSI